MVESLHVLYRAAVCKHLVASKQGSAVSLAITRCDPRVYVEVSRSFSYLWVPGYSVSYLKVCNVQSCTTPPLHTHTFRPTMLLRKRGSHVNWPLSVTMTM